MFFFVNVLFCLFVDGGVCSIGSFALVGFGVLALFVAIKKCEGAIQCYSICICIKPYINCLCSVKSVKLKKEN